MTYTHRVVHTQTQVVVGRFESEQAAREWLEQLGVVREYKERCYRVERIQSFEFYRVGLSWFRREVGNPDSSLFVTGRGDTSRATYGIHGNCPGSEYDSRCASCYLGFSHSLDAHLQDLKTLPSVDRRVRASREVR